MMRTFIAFTLPDEVANQIIEWQQQNMPEGVFPEPVTNLHMTLAFLGETSDDMVPRINEILSRLDVSQVSISGPRAYTEQAKLAFLEFDEVGGSAVWEQLNAELNALMGYEPQFRPWLAHTTVWRFAPDHKPNINPPLPSLSFSPTAVTLYQSVRNEGGGATYQHVSSYPRRSNILDPIEQKLDQSIYQGTTPRKSVQDFIKRIYYRALDKELAVNGEQWADLYLTGSLTTYQYAVTSDCDVSVFPNYDLLWKQLGLAPDEARKKLVHLSIEHLDGTFVPGTAHPLQFFVVPNGTHPGDLYKPGLRSAFDLHDSVWFQKPEKDRVHDIAAEYPDLFKRAEEIGGKLTMMLDAGDDEAARELWHQIHKKRQLDQQAGLGDFCEGNIVYKYLLNEGLFDRIRSELGEFIASEVIAKVPNRDLTHQKWRLAADWQTYFDNPDNRRIWLQQVLMMTPGRDWNSQVFHDKAIPLLELADIPPEAAEQIIQEYRTEMDAQVIRSRENYERVQQEMIKGREKYDREFAIMNEKYGERAMEIFNRFERQRPADAPEFAANRDEIVDYMVTQGWEWKFILELGLGALIWADAETHDYNGVYPHTYAMQDLKNMSDVPLVKKEMAGGWIDKGPLEEGDGPYNVRVLSGEGLTDEQILTTLGFQPGEATVERIGAPLRMEENVKESMPPASEWENFALDIEDRQHNDQLGEVAFANDTGLRWRYNHSTLANVAHLLGVRLTFGVSRGWMQGFGTLNYRVLPSSSGSPSFSFTIELNQALSPEAASYCLWHEIQHAFQLVEGRAEPGYSSPDILTGDAWNKYINDPNEVDADEMAAKMREIEELPVVDTIPITEGSEKEYYEDLLAEGWPEHEALDMLAKEDEEITLEYVINARSSKWKKVADLWEDRVTQKVIYDFDKDTITLGTQATQAEQPDSKIIGEYKDGAVTLYGVEKQWISPQYFHRLWAFSYPEKELKDVYYKREEGNIKLRTVRRPKRSFDDITQRMFDAAPVQEPTERSKWTPQVPKSVMDMAIYKHRCPQCGGYLTDRGGIYTCQSCPFEWDASADDFGGTNVG